MNQLLIGERGLGARVKRKDVLLVEMGIADIGVAGDDGLEHAIGVRLTENLKRSDGIEGRIAHRKKITEKFECGIEVFSNFFDCLADLHDGIEFEITGRDGDYDFVGRGERIEGQPGERRRAINKNEIVAVFDFIELVFEARFPVVPGGRELHIGIGQKNVRRAYVEVGNPGRVNWEGLALENRRVNRLFFL